MKTQSRRRRRNDKLVVALIAFVLLIALTVQIVRLKNKNDEYSKQEQGLEQQLAQETERQQDLKEQEEYMQSQKYIEDIAKSKLGLAYDNEIIFKPSAD